MTRATAEDRVLRAVEEMPSGVTFEAIMERVYLLQKVERGRHQIAAGEGIPRGGPAPDEAVARPIWSPQALADLEAVGNYLAREAAGLRAGVLRRRRLSDRSVYGKQDISVVHEPEDSN